MAIHPSRYYTIDPLSLPNKKGEVKWEITYLRRPCNHMRFLYITTNANIENDIEYIEALITQDDQEDPCLDCVPGILNR